MSLFTKKSTNQPEDTETLVANAEKLVANRRDIHNAIGQLKTRVSQAMLLRDFERANYAEVLADRELHKATDGDVLDCEKAMAGAEAKLAEEQLIQSGLVSRLINDADGDKALVEAGKQLDGIIPGIAKTAIASTVAEFNQDHTKISSTLTRLVALSRACGQPKLVSGLIAQTNPALVPGQPLTARDFDVLEIRIPRIDRVAALALLNDPLLTRILTARGDCEWAADLSRAVRDQFNREEWRKKRAAGNGISRVARHPSADPDPPRPIPAAVERDPDLLVNQIGKFETNKAVMENPAD